MTCAICNSDDCELNYTEDDLYLSNPFIHRDTWIEPPPRVNPKSCRQSDECQCDWCIEDHSLYLRQ